MPDQDRTVACPHTAAERATQCNATASLGDATYDTHLNYNAYLAQRPSRHLELQVRWLPSPQQLALLLQATTLGPPHCRRGKGITSPTQRGG